MKNELIEKFTSALEQTVALYKAGVAPPEDEGFMGLSEKIVNRWRATGKLPKEEWKLFQHKMELRKAAALGKANSDRIHSTLTRNDEGQWVHTHYLDFSPSSWVFPVWEADEGDTRELVLWLLYATLPNAAAYGYALDAEGRALIDDLLDRHQPFPRLDKLEKWSPEYLLTLAEIILNEGLRKKRGRQSTPIYARSERDAQIECAISEVLEFRRVLGRKRDDDKLVEQVAKLHFTEQLPLDAETLHNALGRRRGAARRKKARRQRFF